MAMYAYVGLCMAMQGCVCVCMVMYGYVGLCRVMHGYVVLCMCMYGVVWQCEVTQGYVWLCRVMYAYVGLCMPMQAHVCLCMVIQGYVGLCIPMQGYAQLCMVMHGYVGWCSGIDGFLITVISGSLQKGSELFQYLTLCQLKTAAIFFSPTFWTQSFSFSPHSSPATCQRNAVSTMDDRQALLNISLFNLRQVFAIDINICYIAVLLNLSSIQRNRDHRNRCS